MSSKARSFKLKMNFVLEKSTIHMDTHMDGSHSGSQTQFLVLSLCYAKHKLF